jgi:monoamine oxidase
LVAFSQSLQISFLVNNSQKMDVVIVGAGLAGLRVAQQLSQRGLSVVVLEARDRVGGRTLSQSIKGDVLDLGAQWVGPHQHNILRLLDELRIKTFPQFSQGRKMLEIGGKVSSYRGTVPTISLLKLIDLQLAITRLEKLCKQVSPDSPQTARRSAEWDQMTVADWQQRHVRSAEARAVLDGAVRAIFCVEPRDLSFLHFLYYLRSNSGLMKAAEVKNGAQQDRIAGGAQQLSQKLQQQIEEQGQRVVLNQPVHSIHQSDNEVEVRSESASARWNAKYVVVAVPPALAAEIAFEPALPAARQRMHAQMPMGSVIKTIAVYSKPFWREAGMSGELLSHSGAVQLTFDDSPADSSFGALVGFVLSEAARKLHQQTEGERREIILRELTRYFGAQASAPEHFLEQNWIAEPWSKGCYAGYAPPGLLSQIGDALRQPCGRIHWAGTETAMRNIGYMDGAIESGERAASEILSRIAS